MRYIDLTRLRLPDGWLDKAAIAKKAIEEGGSIEDYAKIWRELKTELAELFHDKCWFCEMPIARSDNAVDHFRPKGRVSDADKDHTGYRWLAFEYLNFRYACTYCNSRRKDTTGGTEGGKGDRFPLLDESKRVYEQNDVDEEQPVLLDPCTYGDWRLLGCKKENGNPCTASQDPIQAQRVQTSIEIYHLHHEPTCKLRHSKALELLANIDNAKCFFNLMASNQSDQPYQQFFNKNASYILNAIDLKSEFSGEMRFILGGERCEEHPWIQELLET